MKILIALIISWFLVVSGHSQTRNVLVGTNNAVVQPTNFWSADASNARIGLGLGTAATNPASAFQSSSSVLSNLASSNAINLTNLRSTNIVGTIPASNIPVINLTNISGTLTIASGGTGGTSASEARQNLGALATNGSAAGLTNFPTVALASNVTGTIAISNGGSGSTNAGGARTNLGLGATWLTNTNVTNFRTEIGLGTNAQPVFDGALITGDLFAGSLEVASGSNSTAITADGIEFTAATAIITRTNLGLGWSALTNTNAGTGLVSVNTNGDVVSPTNFWQVSPANTMVQVSQPVVNATNNATNARNLYFYSLAISTTGTTNTVQLPTNSATLLGDVATVIHEGPTSSVTAIRQTGAGSNLITINQFQEAVKFIYESAGWRLADNISYVEPIYFSGTNASANAAASRTNLGLGATNDVTFEVVNTTSGLRVFNGTNLVVYIGEDISEFETPLYVGSALGVSFSTNNSGAATTRTNLGLGLPALTNTNTAGFQMAIFTTNGPTNIGNFGNHVAWMAVSIVTNGVTNEFSIPLYK